MIKSTNHLASPSLLIKRARILAPDQLELLQKRIGGLLPFGFFVFSWFHSVGYSRLLSAINYTERVRTLLSCIHD